MEDLISRQAAIDALGEEPEVWSGNDEYAQGLNNQWHYDVNALKAVPTAEERKAGTWKEFHGNKNMCICQSCGFMVNKSLLYDYTEKDPLVFKYCPSCGSYNGGAKTEKDVTRLLSLPTIKERKTGRWIDKKCSRCGCGSMLGLCIENFCPNCGADMRGGQE